MEFGTSQLQPHNQIQQNSTPGSCIYLLKLHSGRAQTQPTLHELYPSSKANKPLFRSYPPLKHVTNRRTRRVPPCLAEAVLPPHFHADTGPLHGTPSVRAPGCYAGGREARLRQAGAESRKPGRIVRTPSVSLPSMQDILADCHCTASSLSR